MAIGRLNFEEDRSEIGSEFTEEKLPLKTAEPRAVKSMAWKFPTSLSEVFNNADGIDTKKK